MQIFQVRLTGARLALLSALLLLTALTAVGTVVLLPPAYAATAQAVLVGPNFGSDGKPTNPFLEFSDALNVTTDTIVLAVTSDTAARGIVASGGTDKYTVTHPLDAVTEPIVVVTGQAPTKPQAIRTATLVLDRLRVELAQRQDAAGIAKGLRVSLVTINPASKAARKWKTPVELGIGVFAVGMVASLLILVAFDRQRRRVVARRGRGLPTRRWGIKPMPRARPDGARPRPGIPIRRDKDVASTVAKDGRAAGSDRSDESAGLQRIDDEAASPVPGRRT